MASGDDKPSLRTFTLNGDRFSWMSVRMLIGASQRMLVHRDCFGCGRTCEDCKAVYIRRCEQCNSEYCLVDNEGSSERVVSGLVLVDIYDDG